MIEMGDDYIPIRGCAYNAGKKIYFFTIYYDVILKYYTPPTPTTLSRMCIISAIKVNFSTGGGCDTVGVFAVLSNYAHDNVVLLSYIPYQITELYCSVYHTRTVRYTKEDRTADLYFFSLPIVALLVVVAVLLLLLLLSLLLLLLLPILVVVWLVSVLLVLMAVLLRVLLRVWLLALVLVVVVHAFGGTGGLIYARALELLAIIIVLRCARMLHLGVAVPH